MKYTPGKNKILFVKPPDRFLEDEFRSRHNLGTSNEFYNKF